MLELEWQQVDWTEISLARILPVGGFETPTPAVVEVPKSNILEHSGTSIDDLLDLYRDSGFGTDIILQNPLTHRGPAAACTIGFPLSLPTAWQSQDLKRFRRWICRIHVDLKQTDDGILFSIPHIEVDPIFHWAEHLAFQGQEVYGKTSVKLLKMLLA